MTHQYALSLHLALVSSKAAHANTCKQSHSPPKAKAGSCADSFVRHLWVARTVWREKKNHIFPKESHVNEYPSPLYCFGLLWCRVNDERCFVSKSYMWFMTPPQLVSAFAIPARRCFLPSPCWLAKASPVAGGHPSWTALI